MGKKSDRREKSPKKNRKKTARQLRGDAPVARWRHSATQLAQVFISTFGGHLRVDLRFYIMGVEGKPRPTKKGISLRREELAKAYKALRKAERLLDRQFAR